MWFQKDLVDKLYLLERGLLLDIYKSKRDKVDPAEKQKWLAKEKEEAKERRRLRSDEEDLIAALKQRKKGKKRGPSRSTNVKDDTEGEEEQLMISEDEEGDAQDSSDTEVPTEMDHYISRGTKSRPVHID